MEIEDVNKLCFTPIHRFRFLYLIYFFLVTPYSTATSHKGQFLLERKVAHTERFHCILKTFLRKPCHCASPGYNFLDIYMLLLWITFFTAIRVLRYSQIIKLLFFPSKSIEFLLQKVCLTFSDDFTLFFDFNLQTF